MADDGIDDLLGDGADSNESVTLKASDIPLETTGLSAPAIYLDVIRGAFIRNETVKLNLVEYRQNAKTSEVVAVHVATLVMPTSQVPAWAKFFSDMAKNPPFTTDKEAASDG